MCVWKRQEERNLPVPERSVCGRNLCRTTNATPSAPKTRIEMKNMPVRKSRAAPMGRAVSVSTSQGQGTGNGRLVAFISNRKRTSSRSAVAKPGTNTIIASIGKYPTATPAAQAARLVRRRNAFSAASQPDDDTDARGNAIHSVISAKESGEPHHDARREAGFAGSSADHEGKRRYQRDG